MGCRCFKRAVEWSVSSDFDESRRMKYVTGLASQQAFCWAIRTIEEVSSIKVLQGKFNVVVLQMPISLWLRIAFTFSLSEKYYAESESSP